MVSDIAVDVDIYGAQSSTAQRENANCIKMAFADVLQMPQHQSNGLRWHLWIVAASNTPEYRNHSNDDLSVDRDVVPSPAPVLGGATTREEIV